MSEEKKVMKQCDEVITVMKSICEKHKFTKNQFTAICNLFINLYFD